MKTYSNDIDAVGTILVIDDYTYDSNANYRQEESSRTIIIQAFNDSAKEISQFLCDNSQSLSSKERDCVLVHIHLLTNGELLEDILDNLLDCENSISSAINKTLMMYRDMLSDVNSNSFYSRYNDIEYICQKIHQKCLLPVSNICTTNGKYILAGNRLSAFEVLIRKEYITGCISYEDSFYSHLSLICRENSIPYLTGIKVNREWNGKEGKISTVQSEFFVENEKLQGKELSPCKDCILTDLSLNNESLKSMISINSMKDIQSACAVGNVDIGLIRTELLAIEDSSFLGTDKQISIYTKLSESLPHNQIIIRLFDFGADKWSPIIEKMLGTSIQHNRGLRTIDKQRQLYEKQIEAIVESDKNNNLSLLLPYVSSKQEIVVVKDLISKILLRHQIARSIHIGAMIELPAAIVILKEILSEVDFVSIGSNDLLYSMYGLDRNNGDLDISSNECKRVLFKSVDYIVRESHAYGKRVILCGDIATNSDYIPDIVSSNVDAISIPIAYNK